jgi:hypothetical protein
MRMTMHAHLGIVGQRPGLRNVKPLGNAKHFAGVDIQNLLHRVLYALELRFFKDIKVFRDQVFHVVDHF